MFSFSRFSTVPLLPLCDLPGSSLHLQALSFSMELHLRTSCQDPRFSKLFLFIPANLLDLSSPPCCFFLRSFPVEFIELFFFFLPFWFAVGLLSLQLLICAPNPLKLGHSSYVFPLTLFPPPFGISSDALIHISTLHRQVFSLVSVDSCSLGLGPVCPPV